MMKGCAAACACASAALVPVLRCAALAMCRSCRSIAPPIFHRPARCSTVKVKGLTAGKAYRLYRITRQDAHLPGSRSHATLPARLTERASACPVLHTHARALPPAPAPTRAGWRTCRGRPPPPSRARLRASPPPAAPTASRCPSSRARPPTLSPWRPEAPTRCRPPTLPRQTHPLLPPRPQHALFPVCHAITHTFSLPAMPAPL